MQSPSNKRKPTMILPNPVQKIRVNNVSSVSTTFIFGPSSKSSAFRAFGEKQKYRHSNITDNTDITISASDGIKYYCNKYVLKSKSSVLNGVITKESDNIPTDQSFDRLWHFVNLIMDINGNEKITLTNVEFVHALCFKYKFKWGECLKVLHSIPVITGDLLKELSYINSVDHIKLIDCLITKGAVQFITINSDAWCSIEETTQKKAIHYMYKNSEKCKLQSLKILKIKAYINTSTLPYAIPKSSTESLQDIRTIIN